MTDSFGASEENLYGIESIAADPSNPDLLYLAAGKYDKESLRSWGQWKNGDPEPCDVLKSADRGKTWRRVESFPVKGQAPLGLVFAVFDPNSGHRGKSTPKIFIGVYGEGVYANKDGGPLMHEKSVKFNIT